MHVAVGLKRFAGIAATVAIVLAACGTTPATTASPPAATAAPPALRPRLRPHQRALRHRQRQRQRRRLRPRQRHRLLPPRAPPPRRPAHRRRQPQPPEGRSPPTSTSHSTPSRPGTRPARAVTSSSNRWSGTCSRSTTRRARSHIDWRIRSRQRRRDGVDRQAEERGPVERRHAVHGQGRLLVEDQRRTPTSRRMPPCGTASSASTRGARAGTT